MADAIASTFLNNAIVAPGQEYAFRFTLSASEARTYEPAFRMVQDRDQGWFGETLSTTVDVSKP